MVVIEVRARLPGVIGVAKEEEEEEEEELDSVEACRVTGEVRAPGDTPGLVGMEGTVLCLLFFNLSFLLSVNSYFCVLNFVFALR